MELSDIGDLYERLAMDKIMTGKTVIKVGAEWCKPCKRMSSYMTDIIADNPEIRFYNVDVDDAEEIYEFLGVVKIPSIVIYINGEMINKHEGELSEEKFRELIKNM